ncbi:MAG: hypothetical protein C4289_00505 [Chloroflexota bacterium]
MADTNTAQDAGQERTRPARAPEEKLGRALGWLAGKAVVTARKTKVWQETQRRFEQELKGAGDDPRPDQQREEKPAAG